MSRHRGYYEYTETDCEVGGCGYIAVQQDYFDAKLCVTHLEEAFAEDAADRAVKWAKENA